ARVEHRRGHLVEQRLEEVVVGAVQHRDVHRRALEGPGGVHPAKSTPDHNHVRATLPSTRVCCCHCSPLHCCCRRVASRRRKCAPAEVNRYAGTPGPPCTPGRITRSPRAPRRQFVPPAISLPWLSPAPCR